MPKDSTTPQETQQDCKTRLHKAISVEPDRVGRPRPAHTSALFCFAGHLPIGSQLSLAFSVSPELGFKFEAWLDSPCNDLSEELTNALKMTFPDHAIDNSTKGSETLPFCTQLRAPILDSESYLEAVGQLPVNLGPKPNALPPMDVVALPSPLGRPTAIKSILEAVIAAGVRARVVLSLQPIQLEAFALRQICDTAEQIAELLSDPLLPLVEKMHLYRTQSALQHWTSCSSGVSADLFLQTEEPLSPWFQDALQKAAFGFCAQGKPHVTDAGIDLSLAWARADAPRIALPGSIALQRLARTVGSQAHIQTKDGVIIGKSAAGQRIVLSDRQRGQHLYLCGATGTGKSSLIRRMVRDDIERGFGVAVIDPHGDLIEDLIGDIPTNAVNRVIHADLSQADTKFRLNLLENDGLAPGQHANFVANQLIMTFTRILYRDVPDAFGPMFAAYFRNALMLLMLGSENQAHLGDFDRVFTDRRFRKKLLEDCTDEHVWRFWEGIAQRVTNHEISLESIAPYIVSKLAQYVGNPMLRPILCASHSSVNFFDAMQRGDVFFANLSKGILGESDSRLMGALLTTKIFAAAMRRAQLPRGERRPFRVYLDEFSSYGTDLVGDMLAEGRKFGLELTLANQSTSQIDGRNQGDDIAHAVLANCGSVIAFRTSPLGAPLMADWLGEGINSSDLVKLPNFTAVGRLSSASGIPVTRKFQTLGD